MSMTPVGNTLFMSAAAPDSGNELWRLDSAQSPGEIWREYYFGAVANAGDAADDADPNRDGLSNLLDRFFDVSPVAALAPTDSSALPVAGTEAGNGSAQYLTLSYRKNAQATDLKVDVQTSDDLETGLWQTVTPDVIENLASDPATGDPRFKVKVAVPPGTARKFIRLKVSAAIY